MRHDSGLSWSHSLFSSLLQFYWCQVREGDSCPESGSHLLYRLLVPHRHARSKKNQKKPPQRPSARSRPRSRRHDGRRGGRRGAFRRLHRNRKKGSTRRQRQIAQTKSCSRGGIPHRVWEDLKGPLKGSPACRSPGRANPRSVSSDTGSDSKERWCLCSIGVWRGRGSAGAGWRERVPLNPELARFPCAAPVGSDFRGGKLFGYACLFVGSP